jgi:hypothetical protein
LSSANSRVRGSAASSVAVGGCVLLVAGVFSPWDRVIYRVLAVHGRLSEDGLNVRGSRGEILLALAGVIVLGSLWNLFGGRLARVRISSVLGLMAGVTSVVLLGQDWTLVRAGLFLGPNSGRLVNPRFGYFLSLSGAGIATVGVLMSCALAFRTHRSSHGDEPIMGPELGASK